MSWTKKYQALGLFAASFFVVVGTYNAVVINSESSLYTSDVKFVKRLDEMYGVTVSGREAASVQWQKLESSHANKALAQKMPVIVQTVNKVAAAPAIEESSDLAPAAAVQDELSLNLVEVINTKKWQNGLTVSQFSGSLTTNSGVIESLSVSLPNGEGVSVSFSEMTGNVFEYDHEGELYSGMMYQVDQHVYMVTLTNGPLEGTRLRFTADASESNQEQAVIADNSQDTTNYGNDAEAYDQQQQAEEALSQAAENQEQNIDYSEQSPEQLAQLDKNLQEEAMRAQEIVN